MKLFSNKTMKKILTALFMTSLIICCSNDNIVTGNENNQTLTSNDREEIIKDIIPQNHVIIRDYERHYGGNDLLSRIKNIF